MTDCNCIDCQYGKPDAVIEKKEEKVKMPERIYSCRGSVLDVQGDDIPYVNKEVEYVRADLVPGLTESSSEEWAEGEFRWVKIENEDNPWELAQAYYDPFTSPNMQVSVDDSLLDMSEVVVFGPVIRPPEGEQLATARQCLGMLMIYNWRFLDGCRMVGTIQGYNVGRNGMPAQEQWDCGGIMRTVNAL